jgi:hypothetical protein
MPVGHDRAVKEKDVDTPAPEPFEALVQVPART